MAKEIERKFTVTSDTWRVYVTHQENFIQGYLANNKSCSIRVRLSGDSATLNIKSAALNVYRDEFDYPIPLPDGKELLTRICQPPFIEKTRYYVQYRDHTWEIDEFKGENKGLVIAEIELKSTDELFDRPDWVGKEVSDDYRYYNVMLLEHPFKNW
jgi:adenylate cyclase